MSGDQPVRRRNVLMTAAFTMAGVGGTMALWPLFATMKPAEDERAKRLVFNITPLMEGGQVTIEAFGLPIALIWRTPAELAALENPTLENKSRNPYSPMGRAFRDRDSEASHQPAWAKNWHRSLKPELMVCVANCTRDGCIVRRWESGDDALNCPCCGSRYDLAGRAFFGPARENLRVPAYHFINDTTIELLEAEVLVRL